MLKVLDDRVAIVPMKEPEYKGLIQIPDNVREDRRPDQGIIYCRGENTEAVRVGDHVLFSPYAGTKVTIAEVGVVHIMKEDDVLCRIEDEDPDLILTRSTVRRLMELAVDHMLRLGTETVSVYIECLEGELDGYESSRGFEF